MAQARPFVESLFAGEPTPAAAVPRSQPAVAPPEAPVPPARPRFPGPQWDPEYSSGSSLGTSGPDAPPSPGPPPTDPKHADLDARAIPPSFVPFRSPSGHSETTPPPASSPKLDVAPGRLLPCLD